MKNRNNILRLLGVLMLGISIALSGKIYSGFAQTMKRDGGMICQMCSSPATVHYNYSGGHHLDYCALHAGHPPKEIGVNPGGGGGKVIFWLFVFVWSLAPVYFLIKGVGPDIDNKGVGLMVVLWLIPNAIMLLASMIALE